MSGERVEGELEDRRRATTSRALCALIEVQRVALAMPETIDRELRQAGWDAIDAGLDVLIEQLPAPAFSSRRW